MGAPCGLRSSAGVGSQGTVLVCLGASLTGARRAAPNSVSEQSERHVSPNPLRASSWSRLTGDRCVNLREGAAAAHYVT